MTAAGPCRRRLAPSRDASTGTDLVTSAGACRAESDARKVGSFVVREHPLADSRHEKMYELERRDNADKHTAHIVVRDELTSDLQVSIQPDRVGTGRHHITVRVADPAHL